MEAQKEKFGFQAEVNQLLHLVVHSLYSNKEIFLRELISNASDALDKLRFAALDNNTLYEKDSELQIRVNYDQKARTITISDNGIGMSREEVIQNIGTIAKSGTKAFLEQLSKKQADESHLIGQFGVGFYSAFIVADKVSLSTRRAGEKDAVKWESTGEGEYTLESIEKPNRGTEIVLRIKQDEMEFINGTKLRYIITKYSDHINWPIVMPSEDEKAEKKDEIVNKATAIWTLPKNQIEEEDYKALYKHISHDFEEPMTWQHNRVEGKLDYISLLYVPKVAPFDIAHRDNKHGLKLYVKRVFIMDDADQFLPQYLRFIKGIVDSSDLPLNVSRELLQDNKTVESIRSALTKRSLSMLEKLSEDKAAYQNFWREFGLVLKEGVIEDQSNQALIAKLLRFASTHDDDPSQNVSLDDYISRMKPDQKSIYYITAESLNAAKFSPHLEYFKKEGIEVILLHDRLDEWVTSHLTTYQEKPLQSVAKGKLDIADQEKDKLEEAQKNLSSLTEKVKSVLVDQVKEVRLTSRLTDSPACLVADDADMGREMQRLLKLSGQAVPESKPIFEMNPEHPLIKTLNQMEKDPKFKDWVHIIYDQALLAEGSQLSDPGSFVKRLNDMLLHLSLSKNS